MGTFGAGPFSSDGALDLLEELAERSPAQRAEALERMFLLVKERPDLLGRDFFRRRSRGCCGDRCGDPAWRTTV